jgi:hypothetical protein
VCTRVRWIAPTPLPGSECLLTPDSAPRTPHRIRVVFGKPIKCPKMENPSDKVVQEYLDRYIDELTSLYNDNKDTYNTTEKPPLTVI